MIKAIKNRKGYSSVLLAMIFAAFAVSIAASIGICRMIVIGSECESFGRVWAKAVLSEYDRHLLEDYSIMAYFGGENEVKKKIDAYMRYSMDKKLSQRSPNTGADLTGYELGDPQNFRAAVVKGLGGGTAGAIINGRKRCIRADISGFDSVDPGSENTSDSNGSSGTQTENTAGSDDPDHQQAERQNGDSPGDRVIGNKVVLDTLPSGGISSSADTSSAIEKAKNIGSAGSFRSAIMDSGTDIAFLLLYLGNNVTKPSDSKPAYLRNEWEYVISGDPSDKKNYEYCRTRLFLIRNGLDLVSLYRDEAKVELITTVAELITPGVLGAVTQVLLSEAWAALEAEEDLRSLYKGERVPLIKTAEEWKTGLGAVLDSDSVIEKLDDESRGLLGENRDEIEDEIGESAGGIGGIVKDGLDYDEHLMLLMLTVNENVRTLRIMDIVQIDMKYRYYRDFNMMEYYTGVRLGLEAGGRNHVFEDHYK